MRTKLLVNNMIKNRYIKIAFSFLLISVIYLKTDFSSYYILNFKDLVELLLLSIIVSITHESIRIIKTKLLLSGSCIPLKILLKINIISYFYILPTPSGVGDISRSFYWHNQTNKKQSIKYYSLIVVIDRISSVIVLILISYTYLIGYYAKSHVLLRYNYLLMSILILFSILFFYVLNYIINKKFNIIVNNKKLIIKSIIVLFVDLVLQLIISAQVFLVLIKFGFFTGFLNIIKILSISNIISFLPISLGGIGVREFTIGFLIAKDNPMIDLYLISSIMFFSIFMNQILLAFIGFIIKTLFYKSKTLQ